MREKLRGFAIGITLFAFSAQALGASNSALFDTLGAGVKGTGEKSANEFVLRRLPGERLIPVRVVGGVSQPGTYYVPVGTDFLSLMSLAGGLAPNTDSSRIQYRQLGGKDTRELDLKDIMNDPVKANPHLEANDIIFVPEDRPLISNNSLLVLTTVATVLGVVLGGIAIRQATK